MWQFSFIIFTILKLANSAYKPSGQSGWSLTSCWSLNCLTVSICGRMLLFWRLVKAFMYGKEGNQLGVKKIKPSRMPKLVTV